LDEDWTGFRFCGLVILAKVIAEKLSLMDDEHGDGSLK
jgi:hypothetical protein